MAIPPGLIIEGAKMTANSVNNQYQLGVDTRDLSNYNASDSFPSTAYDTRSSQPPVYHRQQMPDSLQGRSLFQGGVDAAGMGFFGGIAGIAATNKYNKLAANKRTDFQREQQKDEVRYADALSNFYERQRQEEANNQMREDITNRGFDNSAIYDSAIYGYL